MPKKIRKIPMRMCVVCRELKEKRDMLRLVMGPDGKIFIDFSEKANGRGAYICNNPDCVKKLRSRHMLNKIFSCDAGDEIYDSIEVEYFGRKQD